MSDIRARLDDFPDGLDLASAFARVFRGLPEGGQSPRRTWRPWTIPPKRYAIPADETVQDLLRARTAGGSEISIRSPEDLARDGISCPFLYVRMAILAAACDAIGFSFSFEANRVVAVKLWELQLDAIKKALPALEDLSSLLNKSASMIGTMDRFGLKLGRDQASSEGRRVSEVVVRTAETAIGLNFLQNLIEQQVQIFKKKPGKDLEEFPSTFINCLRPYYMGLTGSDIAQSDPCENFIREAYKTIGGSRKSWHRSLKRAKLLKRGEFELISANTVDKFALLLAELRSTDNDGARGSSENLVPYALSLCNGHSAEAVSVLRYSVSDKTWKVKSEFGGGIVSRSSVLLSLLNRIETDNAPAVGSVC